MDSIASNGQFGMIQTAPTGFSPGSDVANLSILGYNPAEVYTGRAPLEAASLGIPLNNSDVAYRCNLVTLSQDDDAFVMSDYSAGHITSAEAAVLIQSIDTVLGAKDISFYPGFSYRHILVWKNGVDAIDCTAPHDISGKPIQPYLPAGADGLRLRELIVSSYRVLNQHPINIDRIKRGLRPANSLWLWGQGRRPKLPLFVEKYGLQGAMISAVDLTKGIGVFLGFDVINVPGATGYIDTNYEGKVSAALEALKRVDFVYLHVEAPDEAGHSGDLQTKLQAIEAFDSRIVKPVFEGMKQFDDYKILLLPDHATPVSLKKHTADPVPFAIYISAQGRASAAIAPFDEFLGSRLGAMFISKGHTLMSYFLQAKAPI
jgi:2,3-bisphosphoglycerate-independent phosphoglycerate mutase